MSNPFLKLLQFAALFGVFLFLFACTPLQEKREIKIELPTPLHYEKVVTTEKIIEETTIKEEQITTGGDEERFKSTPTLPIDTTVVTQQIEEKLPKFRTTAPLSISIEGVPLPTFINEVYGNLLGLSFEIDPALTKQKDLVTLRITQPQKPKQLYVLARQVLNNYGVGITHENNLLRFVPSKNVQTVVPPLIISGRTLPDVPVSHRPIFQIVPLKVISSRRMVTWLKALYKTPKLDIQQANEHNSVILRGTPNTIKPALEVIESFDRPFMIGRYSLRIDPLFLTAQELSAELVKVLGAEGYEVKAGAGARSSNIIILPIETSNAVIVFATDNQVISHIKEWVRTLDVASNIDEEELGLFFYQVKNTSAESLEKVLSTLLTNIVAASQKVNKGRKQRISNIASRLVVDKTRNALIYHGDAKIWGRLLPILNKMDQPAKLVLIEVMVAQVTLTDSERFGVEWLLNNVGIGDLNGTLGTLGGLSINSTGLTYTLDRGGQTRALLNAFAQDDQITILSSPRLMVKSGESASIDVGDEVPVISSQSVDPNAQTEGNSAILQQIQYRSTGVQLSVTPTVYSNDRIDLDISQSVSSSSGSDNNTPTINNRSVTTKLSLDDGSSVLIGGLISTTLDEQKRGIPILGDIPVVGKLFSVEGTTKTRSELIILIVPYIIDNGKNAERISEAFKEQLSFGQTMPLNPNPLENTEIEKHLQNSE